MHAERTSHGALYRNMQILFSRLSDEIIDLGPSWSLLGGDGQPGGAIVNDTATCGDVRIGSDAAMGNAAAGLIRPIVLAR